VGSVWQNFRLVSERSTYKDLFRIRRSTGYVRDAKPISAASCGTTTVEPNNDTISIAVTGERPSSLFDSEPVEAVYCVCIATFNSVDSAPRAAQVWPEAYRLKHQP